jgi:hypothetical protein
MEGKEHWTEEIYKELQFISHYESSLVHALSPEKNRKSFSVLQSKASSANTNTKPSCSIKKSDIDCDYSVATFCTSSSNKDEKKHVKIKTNACSTKDTAVMTMTRSNRKTDKMIPIKTKEMPIRQRNVKLLQPERKSSRSKQRQRTIVRSRDDKAMDKSHSDKRESVSIATSSFEVDNCKGFSSSAEYKVISVSRSQPDESNQTHEAPIVIPDYENHGLVESYCKSIPPKRNETIAQLLPKKKAMIKTEDISSMQVAVSIPTSISVFNTISTSTFSNCDSESTSDAFSSVFKSGIQGSDESASSELVDNARTVCKKSIGADTSTCESKCGVVEQRKSSIFQKESSPTTRYTYKNENIQKSFPYYRSRPVYLHYPSQQMSVISPLETRRRSQCLDEIRKELEETRLILDDSDALLSGEAKAP